MLAVSLGVFKSLAAFERVLTLHANAWTYLKDASGHRETEERLQWELQPLPFIVATEWLLDFPFMNCSTIKT